MVAKKGSRGGTAGEDAEEELSRVPLQAILLADSFATLFRPITLERPKVTIYLEKALFYILNIDFPQLSVNSSPEILCFFC